MIRTASFLECVAGARQAALDAVSAVELGFPHDFQARPVSRGPMRGGARLAIG